MKRIIDYCLKRTTAVLLHHSVQYHLYQGITINRLFELNFFKRLFEIETLFLPEGQINLS